MSPAHGGADGPLVFVEDLDAPVLSPEDHHHLGRVRRLRVGDAVVVGDGRGRWRAARFAEEPEPTGPIVEEPTRAPALTVGLAPVKGQRPEWAVQKLTEIGIDVIWLLVADRSVVRWEAERGDSHAERLTKVAREAAMQCRRPWLPVVRAGVTLAEALAVPGVALTHPGGDPPSLEHSTLLVGPEGGWSPAELAAAPARVGLGPTVLRAETAAVSAAALLSALRAGLVLPKSPPL